VQRSTISSRATAARSTIARSTPWSIASRVDAILKSPVIDISGRDEIRAFAGRFAAQRVAGTQFRHMVSNIAVTITGNRAAASAYLLVLISKDGNHRSLPPGRYACELIKEDSGQWRFSRRTVFHDHDYTLDGIGR
jgi:ketosteroid isomerase-like protein